MKSEDYKGDTGSSALMTVLLYVVLALVCLAVSR
jgi:hypothetical protein